MQTSASTSTHIPLTPFRPSHRRQRSSHANDVQDSNAAGRPFAFVPKRRFSGGTASRTKDSEQCTSHVQVTLSEEPMPDVPSPTSPRSFVTFPRANSDPVHGRLPLPRFEEVASPSSPMSDLSTPTHKATLCLDIDSRTSIQAEAATSITIASAIPHSASASAFPPAYVRKKSGELLKPSLKSSAFATWSGPPSRARTKSAPSTPTAPKCVHFDAKLEHVKLFLAEQKPLAVSRDGSPTETSEGETDTGYPFPAMAPPLSLKPVALPQPLGDKWIFDVQLEQVVLEDGALVGQILVRNVAFAKRVAARFTFDAWQTTCEVAAKHMASLRGGDFDRFEFRIRIADYLRDIESKRLMLCVRYSVDGQEMWDNNAGRNYEVGFERARRELKASDANTSQWGLRKSGLNSMADLRKQLEKVVQDEHDLDGPPPPLAVRKPAQGLRVWISGRDLGDEDISPPSRSPRKDKDVVPSLRDADAPLSARYDFGSSLKSPAWKPPPEPTVPTSAAKTFKPKQPRARAKSPPPTGSYLQFPTADEPRRSMKIPVDGGFPRAPLPRGSPRDFGDEDDGQSRHHTRAWAHRPSYFTRVAEDASALRKTPPGTPIITTTTPTPPKAQPPSFRLNSRSDSASSASASSSPPVSPNNVLLKLDPVWHPFQPGEDESVASTPSMTTSASSPCLSPLSPIGHLSRSASDDSAITEMSKAKRLPVNSPPYHSFLDQFCFFTGVDSPHSYTYSSQNGIAPRRSHSASSVEDYFSTSPLLNDSPYGSFRNIPSGHTTPTRSPIPADFMSQRGLATPRPGTPNEFPSSTMSTPVAG